MGAIAPIDFGDPNITLPFEGCKIDKFTSKIAISTHRFEFLKTPPITLARIKFILASVTAYPAYPAYPVPMALCIVYD